MAPVSYCYDLFAKCVCDFYKIKFHRTKFTAVVSQFASVQGVLVAIAINR